jgi:hypothetical protein
MNVLQKTGRKQEALPFRVNERNGDIATVVESPYSLNTPSGNLPSERQGQRRL